MGRASEAPRLKARLRSLSAAELVERIRERAEVGRYSGHASTAARLRSELVDTSPAVAGLGLADANSVNGYLGAGALSDVVSRNGLIRDDEGGIKFRSTTTDLGIVADLAERETVLAALELAESLDVRERRAYWALSTSDPAAQETIRATDNPYEAKTLAIPALYDQWDPTPPYRQLAALLRARIEAGDLGPGDQLPSESDLVQQYGLARETVRRAVKLLRDDGLVITLPGRGTFVPPEGR